MNVSTAVGIKLKETLALPCREVFNLLHFANLDGRDEAMTVTLCHADFFFVPTASLN